MRDNLAVIASFRQRLHWECVASYLLVTRRLLGANNYHAEPRISFELETLVESDLANGNPFASAHALILLNILAYHQNEPNVALARTLKTRERLAALQGTFAIPLFYDYDSLIQLRFVNSPDCLAVIADNQTHLARWSESAPSDFFRNFTLVEAERHRVLGDHGLASELYEVAVADAATQRALGDEALAAELAAAHCQAKRQPLAASHYLTHAQNRYRKWGSELLALRLESNTDLSSSTKVKQTEPTEPVKRRGELDIESVLRATRAVSSELDLSKLVTTLLRLLIESAGARVGYFLRRTGEEWNVEAEIQAENLETRVLSECPLDQCTGIAASVVRYVARTRQVVLLANAAHEGDFCGDPHIRQGQIRSVLCTPLIARGETNSILYLENALVADAFTVERKEVIDILAAQAAVSLETAHNYQELVELNRSLRQEVYDREQVALKLRDSEERFRRFVMHCPVPFLIISTDGRIDLVNRQFTAVFGYEASDNPDADSWWRLAYPDLNERAMAQQLWRNKFGNATLMEGDIAPAEYQPTTKDGRRLDTKSSARFVGDQLLVVFNDVTARKTAERERQTLEIQLQQSQKMEAIGTLAGGIAHDFNNILVGIIGYTDEAMEYIEKDSKARESLDEVMTCSQRAAALVNQILAFSRKSKVERSSVDLSKVASSVLKLLRVSLPANVKLTAQLKPSCCFVQGDNNQLQQAVMNLCTNAAQAIGTKQGTLIVSIGTRILTEDDAPQFPQVRPGSYVELSVADDGQGMPPDVVKRVF